MSGIRAKPILVLCIAAVFAFTTTTVTSEHIRRIVQPYGLSETRYDVVAGFELLPDPFICGAGTAAGTTLFSESFAGGAWATAPSVTGHGAPILWHQTLFAGKGTGAGHSADGHLYFGVDAQGNYDVGRSSGDAVSPVLNLPADGAKYVSFATKWEVEYFNGYDHMWVQVQDLTDGQIYILCKLNPPARPDATSSDTTTPACSPEMFGPCPNLGGSLLGLLSPVDVDAAAPHWEHRYVQIPSFLLGKDIRLQLSFDSADPVSNVHMGWMVDDVAVSTDVVATFQAFPTEL